MQNTKTATRLNFLTRSGAVTATFTPALIGDYTAELVKTVQSAGTRRDLCSQLEAFATRWGVQVEIENCDD